MATDVDSLIRFILPKYRVRGCLIRGTQIHAASMRTHGLAEQPAQLFSQLLLGAILMLSMNKGGVRQVLQLDATNAQQKLPIRRMLAEVRNGCVRGYLQWQDGNAVQRNDSDAALTGWMGNPLILSVVRDTGIGEPYVSTVESSADFITDHLLRFATTSVQTRADMILCNDLGIMLEAMPGCSDTEWFAAIKVLAGISSEHLERFNDQQLLDEFSSVGIKVLGRDTYQWHCGCQPERMLQSIMKMERKDLETLTDTDGYVSVSCQYCKKLHRVHIDS